MVDLLKRELAPITAEAWAEIDDTAVRTLKSYLSARRILEVKGPHGWDFAAVNLGRLDLAEQPGPHGVPWGLRQVLPLIELRVPMTLSQMELDCVTRGCKDADLRPVEKAARNIALFEEAAIYDGFAAGRLQGLSESSAHEPVDLPSAPQDYPAAVAEGVKRIQGAGVPGPYALVLGTEPYYALMQSTAPGYPARKTVEKMTGNDVHLSRVLTGGLLVSTAEGNFEIVLGQDLSIGYWAHDRHSVELYLTESLTFRVLQPEAVVELK